MVVVDASIVACMTSNKMKMGKSKKGLGVAEGNTYE
jgi:hypothetical protein